MPSTRPDARPMGSVEPVPPLPGSAPFPDHQKRKRMRPITSRPIGPLDASSRSALPPGDSSRPSSPSWRLPTHGSRRKKSLHASSELEARSWPRSPTATPIIHATAALGVRQAQHASSTPIRRDGCAPASACSPATYRGFTGLVEGVNTFSPKLERATSTPSSSPNATGQTPVADAERTDVNRFWLQFATRTMTWAGLKIKSGRQRDQARRRSVDRQRRLASERADLRRRARLQTNLGTEELPRSSTCTSWEVNRIFGEQRTPPGTLDFDPRCPLHQCRLQGRATRSRPTVFRLPDRPRRAGELAAHSDRRPTARDFTGSIPATERRCLHLRTRLSYAYPGRITGRNQVSYDAHYVYAEAGAQVQAGGDALRGGLRACSAAIRTPGSSRPSRRPTSSTASPTCS